MQARKPLHQVRTDHLSRIMEPVVLMRRRGALGRGVAEVCIASTASHTFSFVRWRRARQKANGQIVIVVE